MKQQTYGIQRKIGNLIVLLLERLSAKLPPEADGALKLQKI